MISFLTYNSRLDEIAPLKVELKDIAALLTEEKWQMSFFSTLDSFNQFVQEKPLVDMSCYDVTSEDAVSNLLEFRKDYDDSMLIIVADVTTSPTEYLRPGIKADSLLLRPYTADTVKHTLRDFVTSYLSKLDSGDDSNCYVIEDREGRTSIPYKDIYYIEAKEKKVFVRTLNEEFGFYSTLDDLENELPEEFARCHRSFIVNKNKIQGVYLSQNYIMLNDDLDVPLSRSYKPEFKILR